MTDETVVVDDGQTYVSEETAIIATEAAKQAKQWAEESERQANIATTNADAAVDAKDDAVDAKNLAQDWATKTDGTVDGTDYSAKYYAQAILPIASDITTVAGIASDVTTVSSISSDVTSVASNSTDISTVADNISDVNSVATDILKVTAVADDLTNIDAVNANKTNIDTVAGISTDVTTVSGISSDVTSVASNNTDISAVADDLTNIDSVAGNLTNIDSVAGDLANIDAIAGDLTNINNASTYADNANIWAEGTDEEVQALGGEHSAEGWAKQESSNYSVTATGSTTSRTLKDRFADVINVKDFGAIGNGVSDDTVAFQAAIDKAQGSVIGDWLKTEDTTYGIGFPKTVNIFVPQGKYRLTSLLDTKNKDVYWIFDAGVDIDGKNYLQGAISRLGRSVSSRTYGISNYASAFSVQSNTSDYDNPNDTFGIRNPSGLGTYPSRDCTAINFHAYPHKFSELVSGCSFTATRVSFSTPLSSDVIKNLRKGMVIDTYDENEITPLSTKWSGFITGWDVDGNYIDVYGWYYRNQTTTSTPSSVTKVIINPCTTIIGLMGYSVLPDDVKVSWAFGGEFDIVNNKQDCDVPTANGSYSTRYTTCYGVHTNNVGTYKATAAFNVEGKWRAGLLIGPDCEKGVWSRNTGVPFYCSNSGDTIENYNVSTGNSTKLSRTFLKFNSNVGGGSPTSVRITANTTGGSETETSQIVFDGGVSGGYNSGNIKLYGTTCTQDIKPLQTNNRYCGTSDYAWAGGFTQTAFTITSDEREKQDIADIDERVLKAWGRVEFKQFLFNDAVEQKGKENARIHFGLIAQKVKEAFELEELDAFKYGLLCYDEWNDAYDEETIIDEEAEYDEEGELIKPEKKHVVRTLSRKAGNKYGIRYEEALALECAYQRWKLEQMQKQLDKILNKDYHNDGLTL